MLRALASMCMVALTIVSAACRRDTPRVANSADTVAAAASGAETFYRYGLTDIGKTREELQKRFGKPDSVVARAVQNLHVASQTDSLITIYYPGIVAEIYRVSGGDREFPASIRVSDNTFIHETAPIRIGVPESDLDNIMGPPAERGDNTVTYLCDTCTALGNERIAVHFANGRVAAVTIFYSYD
jgi:hypothetical protein